MAETTAAPNNARVRFGGKSTREFMPVASKSQNAAMHAAAEGKSTLGIPKSVGKEFTADQAPGSVKNLPERVGKDASKLRKRGLISDKAMAKFGGKAKV